jgi:ribosomal protein S1
MDKGNGVAALVYEGEAEGTVLYDEVWDQKNNLPKEFKFELGKIVETEILYNHSEGGKIILLIKEFPHDSGKKT